MKELFKQRILDFHQTAIKPLKARTLVLPIHLEKILVVTGMRRVGKSSLLLNSIRQLREQIPIKQIIYINFEDERLTLSADSLDALLQAYRELYPDIDLSRCYFFFDEIQEIDGWEKFVRRLDDSVSKHIFITGSNAKLLSSDIATALRGRSIRYELFPLSFPEYLAFRDIAIDSISSQGRAKVQSAFHQYVQTGGFPELALIDDKDIHTKIIQEYYDVMIFRDIVERYQESNLPALKYFLKRLIESVGSPISISKIHNEMKSLGYRVAKNTLHDYYDIAEAVYLVVNASKYDPSLVRQTMADKKAYIIDNAFLTQLTYRYSQDLGKLLENMIAVELRRRQLLVQFIKGAKECDFVLQTQEKTIPLQV
jgi:predicted AAA+ superfamily ATPase